ncbi:MAG: hypothetical protein U9R17_14675 [Thermodesulfobacteriota bacterium]|nr:hypothetical protein [Thermodesulfobacteriota bacterium]
MKLDLLLTCRDLNQLWHQAVVGFLFENETFYNGHLHELNKKLENYLSHLSGSHLLTGKQEEVFLIDPQGKINADKLLFFGLGPISGYLPYIIDIVTEKASVTLESLQLYDILIIVSHENEIKTPYIDLIKSIIINLIEYCNKKKFGEMKVVFLIEEPYMEDLKNLKKELGSYFDPIVDYSILIEPN